ncbi:hypothetical protein HZI73_22475 [Vallitalea pronyensis]|uniref:Uncharacterized protein n=1 Tax=Vallitalea pronyensis TaxID=1348613 RepID=A0A8J8SIS0_9FIRM|nr:hypothetical protein [Vallitalea pronyensis]QUI24896.1 hypothetical protein HZI73_22475 [Vallitalea pronyensis]
MKELKPLDILQRIMDKYFTNELTEKEAVSKVAELKKKIKKAPIIECK